MEVMCACSLPFEMLPSEGTFEVPGHLTKYKKYTSTMYMKCSIFMHQIYVLNYFTLGHHEYELDALLTFSSDSWSSKIAQWSSPS